MSQTVTYLCRDNANNIGKTGDASNHTLRLVLDGTVSTPTNSPTESDATNLKGVYELELTEAEYSHASVTLSGITSTADCEIIPTLLNHGSVCDPDLVMLGEAIRQGYDPTHDTIVKWADTNAGRGTNLKAAITAVAELSPTATRWGRVWIPPWNYNVGATSLTLGTDYVALIALFPEQGGFPCSSDVDYYDGSTSLEQFRPPASLVYTSEAGVDTVVQSAQYVYCKGFGVAQLSGDTETYYCGYIITAATNKGSTYDCMYFWHKAPYSSLRSPVCASRHFSGMWINCIANACAYRVGYTENDGDFSPTMVDCLGGSSSFAGDYSTSSPNQKVTDCYILRCKQLGSMYFSESLTINGYAFAGCSEFALPIDSSSVFIDCESSDNSFGVGAKNEGIFIRCRGRENCFAGTTNSGYLAEFAGYAEDCYGESGSFGGFTSYGQGKLTGILNRCTCKGNTKTIYCDGATILNSTITTAATNVDTITIIDSNSQIHNCTLLPVEGGTGIPINASTAKSVSAAGNRYGNASAAANGLGTNVTNLATIDVVPKVTLSDTTTTVTNDVTTDVGEIASALASRTITVTSPVTEDQDVELVSGRDYLTANGRQLAWSNTSGDWANSDLADATITFTAEIKNGDGTDVLAKTGTVATATGTQRITVDLTAAETALFTLAGNRYKYHVTIEDASGYKETVVTGNVIVTLPL